jgi:hypothetical protein
MWNGQLLGFVVQPLLMGVDGRETLLAERRRFEAGADLADSKAFLALPLGEGSADRALTWSCGSESQRETQKGSLKALTILDDVGDVENLRGKNPRVHLVALAETRHLDDETRWNLLQLDV